MICIWWGWTNCTRNQRCVLKNSLWHQTVQKWSNDGQFWIKKFGVIGEVNEFIFWVRCLDRYASRWGQSTGKTIRWVLLNTFPIFDYTWVKSKIQIFALSCYRSLESTMGLMDKVWKGTCSTQPRTPTNATIPTPALPHMLRLHINNHMAKAPQEPLNAQCAHSPSLHAHACHQWCHLQQSDKSFSHHLQSGQCIRSSILCLWHQLHLLGPHQGLVTRRTPVHLPQNLRVIDGAGLQTPPPQNGQWNIARGWELHSISTDSPPVYTTGHPTNPTKCMICTWKVNSLQALLAFTSPSPLQTGATSPNSVMPHSTCSAPVAIIPSSWPTKRLKASSCSMLPQWPH